MGRDAIIGWRFGSCLLLAIMMNSILGLPSEKLACNDATTLGRSKFQPIIDSPPSNESLDKLEPKLPEEWAQSSGTSVKRRRRTPLQAGGACEAPPHEVDTKSI